MQTLELLFATSSAESSSLLLSAALRPDIKPEATISIPTRELIQ